MQMYNEEDEMENSQGHGDIVFQKNVKNIVEMMLLQLH